MSSQFTQIVWNDFATKAIQGIVAPELARLKANVADWFEMLVTQMVPIYSGYAASNVRLQVRNAAGQFKSGAGVLGNVPPLAQKEPFAKGKYSFNIRPNWQQEMEKLDVLEIDDVIFFTLDVDYDNENFEIALAFDVIETVARLYTD